LAPSFKTSLSPNRSSVETRIKKRKRGEGKEREKMFWFIFMADFISGNPVQQNLMEEEMPSSYFNSIITTLMQVNINACQINELNCDFEIDRLDIGLT